VGLRAGVELLGCDAELKSTPGGRGRGYGLPEPPCPGRWRCVEPRRPDFPGLLRAPRLLPTRSTALPGLWRRYEPVSWCGGAGGMCSPTSTSLGTSRTVAATSATHSRSHGLD
jgi:hypothetical protein